MKLVCLLVSIERSDGGHDVLALSPTDDAWFVDRAELTPDARAYFEQVVDQCPGAELLGGVYQGEWTS